jgi:hypothetical protein
MTTERRAQRRRTNYLYLFESEAVMRTALARYQLSDDAEDDIWAHVFKVPLFSEMTPYSYALYVSRVSYQPGFRKAKWWDVGALAIWEVADGDLADYKHTHVQTIKYVEGHPAIGGLSALGLFGHVAMTADPEAKPYRGAWVGDDRYEDRPDRPGIARFLKQFADHVITGNQDIDEPLITELTTLHSFELSREHQIALFTAEGATLTEVARYLNAIRFPAKQELWAGGAYLNKFHPELNGHIGVEDIKAAQLELHICKTKVLQWAVAWKNRYCAAPEDATLLAHISRDDLQGLFAALDKPVLFVREDWIACAIDLAYVVRDPMTSEWFMVYQTPNYDLGTIERKLHLADGHMIYELGSATVMLSIPKNCSAERCYDEHDARYKLAKWYAKQLETKQ